MTTLDWFSFVTGFVLSPVMLIIAGLALFRYDRWKADKEGE
jgi:hypothetical protein